MQLNSNILLTFDNVLGKRYRSFYMGIAMLWIVGYHLYIHDAEFYNTQFKLMRTIF